MQDKDLIMADPNEKLPPGEDKEITPIELSLDAETVEILLEDRIATGG